VYIYNAFKMPSIIMMMAPWCWNMWPYI